MGFEPITPGLQNQSSTVELRWRRFPLTLHCTGQYCKRIRGRIHYFGRDKQEALRKYYEQASALHSGTDQTAALLPSKLTLENLCNLYLDHQLGRAKAGEIRERQYHEQKPRLKAFADFIGRDRLVAEVKTIELLNYRKKRIEDGRAPVTINDELAIIKAMFHWAQEAETCPRKMCQRGLEGIRWNRFGFAERVPG